MENQIDRLFHNFFRESVKHRIELVILYLAIGGFIIHLILIFAHQWELVSFGGAAKAFFDSPTSAIYTPFSFILIYEVFLLVFYIPDSFTTSIAKQYEIISLILVRRIYKDIAKMHVDAQHWFDDPYNVQLTVDMIGILLLFFLIFLFYYCSIKRPKFKEPKKLHEFITFKRVVSLLLIPILFGLAIYSLVDWLIEAREFSLGAVEELSDVNKIFYNEFFNLLILVDVFILIVSLKYTNSYSQLIRNSGFIISTVLIRISFTAEGIINTALIVGGVAFGVLILAIYNLVGKMEIASEIGDGELEREN